MSVDREKAVDSLQDLADLGRDLYLPRGSTVHRHFQRSPVPLVQKIYKVIFFGTPVVVREGAQRA